MQIVMQPIKNHLQNDFVSGSFSVLSDQGSNLDSSDPESDVLPITPSDNFYLRAQNYTNF